MIIEPCYLFLLQRSYRRLFATIERLETRLLAIRRFLGAAPAEAWRVDLRFGAALFTPLLRLGAALFAAALRLGAACFAPALRRDDAADFLVVLRLDAAFFLRFVAGDNAATSFSQVPFACLRRRAVFLLATPLLATPRFAVFFFITINSPFLELRVLFPHSISRTDFTIF
jgi:hypothetical protein